MATHLLHFISLSFLLLSSVPASEHPKEHQDGGKGSAVVMVIVGGRGDLARRFLWPAVHEFLMSGELSPHSLLLYAASREPHHVAENTTDFLFSQIHCSSVESDSNCSSVLSLLHQSTHYVQLKSEENYTRLNEMIHSRVTRENLVEIGRIFYLSVPPFAYSQISENIHLYARPLQNSWLRVVLEKPFGRDLDSALGLTTELENFFSEDELVRVDHYLGKPGVKQIWEFRKRNRGLLLPLWNARNVDYVEVVAREKVDVKGRSGYYNEYGAIRDMLQNHLTEITSLVAASIHGEEGTADIGREKLEVLRSLYPPLVESVVVGQYAGYLEHLIQDGVTQTIGNNSYSTTPTFASAVLYLRDPDWSGVPFLVTSGKRMGEKVTFARVVFRNSRGVPVRISSQCSPEIMFFIQGDHPKEPAVFISHHFDHLEFLPPYPDWRYQPLCSLDPPPMFLQPFCSYGCFIPSKETSKNSYASVFSSILSGRKGTFVSTENLLESWRVWTPLLKELEITPPDIIFTYTPDVWKHVKLQVDGTALSINAGTSKLPDIDASGQHTVNVANTSTLHEKERSLSKLLGFSVHVSPRSALVTDLAKFLHSAALKAVEERGVFHLALPGGASLLPLHQVLALNYRHSFPWEKTHVWQTDERCAPSNGSSLNALQLSDHLLQFVSLPHHQFHPMPISLNHGLCSSEDAGPELYERDLVSHLPEGKFDFVFLGLGRDGHIASLFPEDAHKDSWGTELVQVVKMNEDYPVKIKQRMTLTYGGLLASRQIAILTIGEEKRGIFRKLRDRKLKGGSANMEDLPIEKLLQQAKDVHLWVDLQCI